MIHTKQSLGFLGESLVLKHLIQQGFTILARNYRIRGGELDIVARKKDVVTFVEVKTRKTVPFSLSSVIVRTKQNSLVRTAKRFIYDNDLCNYASFRFDVALVNLAQQQAPLAYLENAFTPPESDVYQ